jgi:hypothetical protein
MWDADNAGAWHPPQRHGKNPFEDYIRLRNHTDRDAVFLVTAALRFCFSAFDRPAPGWQQTYDGSRP